MKKQIAVQLQNISKRYLIHHEKNTLVESIIRNKYEKFYALKNINLKIFKGQKVGIYGPNGSGKTTLLKIICGISTPTSGSIKIDGKIISLIGLEAGFHPDLTGIENIYINGSIIGLTISQINNKINTIIKFSGLKKFIDVPVFKYSQGMKLRLGFAIAISANPDILILDEGLAAGDAAFIKKIEKVFKKYFQMKKTIIVVTHNKKQLIDNNFKILYLDKGSFVNKLNK